MTMAERAIFGYFQTIDAAQKAAAELRQAGFEVDVSRFSPLGGGKDADGDATYSNPFENPRMSLAESTLGSPRLDPDKNVMQAAHPDASGLSGGQPLSSLEDVSVTVFATSEDRVQEAESILRKHGARE
ncbi:hypothetical protein ADL26_00195 [Thermoactinomyces vulgaris]|jgi:hypothetical protein|nr:hypothetical protein ADL26_00195 [Thermoactinomyces vulgaris]